MKLKEIICLTGKKRSGKDTCANIIASKHTNKNRIEVMRYAGLLKEFIFLTVPMGIDYGDFCGSGDYDRTKKIVFNKNNFLIALDSFLMKINTYIETNGVSSTFDPEKTRDIGRKVIQDNFVQRNVINVTNRDFVVEEVHISAREILQFFGTDIARALDDKLWSKLLVSEMNKVWELFPHTKIVISDLRMDVEMEVLLEYGFEPNVIHVTRPNNKLENIFGNHISESGVSKDYIDFEIINDGSLEDLENKVNKIIEEEIQW